jgi:hypothetical protein
MAQRNVDPDSVPHDVPVPARQLEELASHPLDVASRREARERLLALRQSKRQLVDDAACESG